MNDQLVAIAKGLDEMKQEVTRLRGAPVAYSFDALVVAAADAVVVALGAIANLEKEE